MTQPSLMVAVDIIKKWEGFKDKAYLCPAGKLTIGYGRTHGVQEGDTTTEPAEDVWLLDYLVKLQKDIDALVDVPLSRNQNAALISFVYNLGIGAFRGSTLREMLNRGRYFDAACQFTLWVWADGKRLQGLVNRRADEVNLFCSP